jgi:hypothetical protein
VDAIHVSNGHAVNLDLGLGQIIDLGDTKLPVFDNALDVTLNIHQSQFNEIGEIAKSLADAGIDHLTVFSNELGSGDLSTLLSLTANNLDVSLRVNEQQASSSLSSIIDFVDGGLDLLSGKGLSHGSTWGDLIQTLHDSGLGGIAIERNASVTIGDDLSAALYESGMLHALPDANILIDAGSNKLLHTSLKGMADLGVDGITSTQDKLYVELGLNPQDAHTIADLYDLFAAFGQDANGVSELFGGKAAGLVIDHGTFSSLGPQGVQELVGELSKLGFTEIDVLGETEVEQVIQITPQTPIFSEVQILGAVNSDLANVFDPDILHKPIK